MDKAQSIWALSCRSLSFLGLHIPLQSVLLFGLHFLRCCRLFCRLTRRQARWVGVACALISVLVYNKSVAASSLG
jgi:hypothetical protein